MKDIGNLSRREFLAATTAAGACICGLNGCIVFSTAGDTPQIHPPAYAIAASDKKIFKCISLNRAEFSCDGRVIDGPTRKALASYPIRRQDQKLIISDVASHPSE